MAVIRFDRGDYRKYQPSDTQDGEQDNAYQNQDQQGGNERLYRKRDLKIERFPSVIIDKRVALTLRHPDN